MGVQVQSKLALLGGPKAIQTDIGDMFTWPIVTSEDEKAVLDVLRRGAMSDLDVTLELEKEFAQWQGLKHVLAHSTGTAAIEGAMFGCKVGVGDEIICPSVTYWASCLEAYCLGATIVFADICPDTLCIDPADIEHRITSRTKAIVAVHYMGYPCDMDPIMEIARRHGVKVIEDVSHAHGALYKGRKVGTFGNVAAMSIMTAKALAAGEGGLLATDDTEIYERAVAWGHYERYTSDVQAEYLREFAGLPLGGRKYRMHQMTSAMARVQLKHFDHRCTHIQLATNYFWDLLEGVPGIRAHRPPKDSGSTMGGWYAPHGLYVPEELGGLSVSRFVEAVSAEGVFCTPGCNSALHTHPLFHTADVYNHGKPTRIANSERDLRQPPGSLPVSEATGARTYGIPAFRHYVPQIIEEHAEAYRKVALNYKDLLPGDKGNPPSLGGWHFFRHG
jgi:perosamine synthetase